MATQDNPQLAEYLQMVLAQAFFDARTAIVARVLEYKSKPRPMVTVQLAPQSRKKPDSEARIDWQSYPNLVDVPVMELVWGPFHVRAELERGDDGLCLIHDRDIDQWLTQGGGEYRPGVALIHDINDAMFLPMIQPDSQASLRKSPGPRKLVIGDATGEKCEIELDESSSSVTIKAAGTATVSAARIELDAFAGLPGGPFNLVGVNAGGLCTHVTSVAPGGGPVTWTPNTGQVVIP